MTEAKEKGPQRKLLPANKTSEATIALNKIVREVKSRSTND
jgi:hypothetical protein